MIHKGRKEHKEDNDEASKASKRLLSTSYQGVELGF
jgi:hypothetical protein